MPVAIDQERDATGKLRMKRKQSGTKGGLIFQLESIGDSGLIRVKSVGADDEISYLVPTEPLNVHTREPQTA